MTANSDGGAYFGWFNKNSIENTVNVAPQSAPLANFLAVEIEGPSSVGHYFRPVMGRSDAQRRDSGTGPIIFPDGQAHDFSMLYDPAANGGLGQVIVTLDSLSQQFNLTTSDRSAGATFDHFGLFGFSPDGNFVEPWFDDLSYTVAPEPSMGAVSLIGMLAIRRRRKPASRR